MWFVQRRAWSAHSASKRGRKAADAAAQYRLYCPDWTLIKDITCFYGVSTLRTHCGHDVSSSFDVLLYPCCFIRACFVYIWKIFGRRRPIQRTDWHIALILRFEMIAWGPKVKKKIFFSLDFVQSRRSRDKLVEKVHNFSPNNKFR
jgi:hypothetical protein